MFAALLAVPGVPLAILLARGHARSLSSLLVQGQLLGLGLVLAVALSTAHSVGISRVSVGLPVAAIAVAGWVAVVVSGQLRPLPRPRLTWPGAAMAVVLIGALALRLHPVYFLAQTADFGEYVNRGNVVADGGPFIQWFLQLFSIALALSKLVVGQAAVVDLVPFLGMLLIAGLVTIAYELGFRPVVRTALAAVVALHVGPVWFSLLPTSESLYAVLLVALLLFVLLALQRGHHAEAAVAGGFVGLQMVTRGNALLLLPVLVVGVAVAAVLVPRDHARRLATFLAAATVATYVGFAYNTRFSHPYFVEHNLRSYLQREVVDVVEEVGRGAAFVVGLAVVLVATAALVVALDGLNRLMGPPRSSPVLAAVRVGVVPAALAGCVVAVVVLGPAGMGAGLGTYGIALGLVAAAGAVAVLRSLPTEPAPTRALLAPAVLVAGAFAVLFAYRIPEMRESFTYLYWERYLFSEVFPVVAILSLWGLALGERAVRAGLRRLEGRRGGRVVGGAVVVVVVVVALAELTASTALVRQDTYFAGFHDHMAELDRLTTGPDGEPELLLFVGMQSDLPEGWFHLNTHRVFSLPMIESFDRRILNGRQPAFQFGDRPVDVARVGELLEEAGEARALAVEVVAPGAHAVIRPGAGRRVRGVAVGRRVGVVEVELPVLADHPRGDRSWRRLRVDLVVTEVRRTR
ncbi:MAG TPA: hypothetical protein VMN58_01680 [Acidimicrobiales bacterium]|nr:hypothetical protein [Acidimicrobiales bacterium]